MFTLTLWLIIALIGLFFYVSPSFSTRRMYEGFVSTTVGTKLPSPNNKQMKLEDVLKAARVAPVTPIKPSPNSTAGPSPDIDTLMRNIQDVVRVQTYTPDLGNEPSLPTRCNSAPIKAVGAKASPKDASTTKSQPATSHTNASKSGALDQGKAFQKTIPKTTTMQAKPTAMQAKPTATQAKPKAMQAKPTATQAKPTATQAKPKATQAKPKATQAKPTATKQAVVERIVEKVVHVPTKCPPQQKCPPKQKCPSAPLCPDMRDYIRKDSIPCWACKLK